ncbi:MAG: hypothetical protein KGQ41_07615 [Alphaproteobacteria bacterium]|nr:hypothetical protein [Alphaproteobacteria bacterium]
MDDYRIRQDLLSRTKEQYEPGAMRPRLCEVFKINSKVLDKPAVSWLYYAGMGDVDVSDASQADLPVIAKLRSEGYLVPTWADNIYGVKHYRLLTHFDDVNWGRDQTGRIVIYNFNQNDLHPEIPDPVIVPDASHATAIKQLEHRMQYGKTMDDDAVILRDGSRITPILTDRRVIDMRRRQKGIIPGVK